MKSKDTRSQKTVAKKFNIAVYSIVNSINKATENFGVERNQ